jgi:N-acetylglutamate synthase-like GNAT family acetyltransferase
MSEIRTIRDSEAEAFLTLLCEVFKLDQKRARSIFYNEPLFDLKRKWALFEGGRPVSILTTVGLEFGWGKAIGIAGVATRRDRQKEGLAAQLMAHVLERSREEGVCSAYLFARDRRLYERVGFEMLDEAIYAPIVTEREFVLPRTLGFQEIQQTYGEWSRQGPARLIRDESRWRFWSWNLRVCTEHAKGDLCLEGSLVREVVPMGKQETWRLPPGTEWFGLRSMAERLEVPIRNPRAELMLMGWNSPGVPELFMTDQF